MEKQRKVSPADFLRMKEKNEKITMITAYDYPMALLAEKAGVDSILVGDSYGMVVLGYESTIPVSMDEMLVACKAVTRAARIPLIVGDMPFMSFQVSETQAVTNALRMVKEGGVDAVKLEGGNERMANITRAIIQAGVPVLGHAGLTPQTAPLWGGYRVQGRTPSEAKALLKQAKDLESVGAFALVLEQVVENVAKEISEALRIPTVGIGSGRFCDGQVLVLHDILGLYPKFTPKFAKKYADVASTIQHAVSAYVKDVRTGLFPSEEHIFH